jgi:thymidylate synthase ThyX
MTYAVKVVADSLNPHSGVRLTTLQLSYPRFIHAEFMTHRVFSRNASSSRAIPVAKTMASLRHDPVLPVTWGRNQKGMQAREALDADTAAKAEAVWLKGMEAAMVTAEALMELGVHKQIANRVLEPWSHISVICTATEWDNFFDLRDHADAQPEIQKLARMMREQMNGSTPRELHDEPGAFDWHLPYFHPEDLADVKLFCQVSADSDPAMVSREYGTLEAYVEYTSLLVSAARCARVSYNNHDGSRPEVAADIGLAKSLLESKHMSPFEHQATTCNNPVAGFHANLRGFHSFRYLLDMQTKRAQMEAMNQKNFFAFLRQAGYEGVPGVQ